MRLDEQLGRIVDEFLEREIEPNSLLGSGYRTASRIDDFKMEHEGLAYLLRKTNDKIKDFLMLL